MTKKIIQLLFGYFILTFGVSLIILSQKGAGTWDAINIGLSEKIGYSIGTWTLTTCAIILLISACVAQKKPDPRSLIGSLLGSAGIDFWMLLIFKDTVILHPPWQWLFFSIGLVVLAFGASLYIHTQLFYGPVDSLMVAVSHRFQLDIKTARTFIELIALSLAMFLGGPIGIGTFIFVVTIGPLIQFHLHMLHRSVAFRAASRSRSAI